MCPMVHSDGTDSGDGVCGVGHGGRFGQSPCVPWYIQTGWTVGMGYVEWDMGEGLDSPHVSHGSWSGTWGMSPAMCPMGHGKVSTVLMCPMVGRLEWDMGDGLDSPLVGRICWSGTWGKVWTVPMCHMVVGVGHGGCPHVSHGIWEG